MVILILLICVLLLYFVLATMEGKKLRNFSPLFFKIGIPVYKKNIPVIAFPAELSEKQLFAKEEGVFYFADDGNIYFSSQNKMKSLRVQTPFKFKAIGMMKGIDQLKIVARLPMSSVITSLVFCCIGLIIALLPGGLGVGTGFILFPFAIFLISYITEKGRMDKMIDELRELLSGEDA